jgi:hypothetical protein
MENITPTERYRTERKPIYPIVKIEFNKIKEDSGEYAELTMDTNVRLIHEGKYYLTNCHRNLRLDKDISGQSLLEISSTFYMEIFNMMKFGKVDVNVLHMDSLSSAFELDPDQRSEEERRIDILKFCK